MTDPLTRPLSDNQFLRAVSGPDLTVGLGSSLGAVFDTPMMTGLVSESWDRAGARTAEIPDDEKQRIREAEFERQREIRSLEDMLRYLPDGEERNQAMARVDQLGREKDQQVSSALQQSVAAGRMMSEKDLGEAYGELGLKFDRPMTREEAALLADNKRAEIIRNALIEKGPQGVVPTVARFGAGVLATATDPLEVASMFIPVVGQAGKAAAIARFGRIGGRAAIGATEGLVGSLLTEPVYAGMSRANQLDYSMNEALLNIGLGTLLGGFIGAGSGFLSRSGQEVRVTEAESPRLSIEHQREVADVALRQFVNGEVINLGKLMDGTDLRASTTLSRVGGIEFQAEQVLPDLVSREIRPTYLAVENGKVATFDTVQKADAYAAKVGGDVLLGEDGFVVRRTAEGDFVRRPTGEPLTFKTERAAEKFLASARNLPEGATVMPLPQEGRPVFAISKGMTEDERAAMMARPDLVKVPEGVNTRQAAVLPDAEARIAKAARDVVAKTQIAVDFAQRSSELTSDPAVDIRASEEMEVPLPDTFSDEELADLEAQVAQIELTEVAQAEMAEIISLEQRAATISEVAEAAATCLRRAA